MVWRAGVLIPWGTVLVPAVDITASLAAWTYDFLAMELIWAASLDTGGVPFGGDTGAWPSTGELPGELVG